MNYGGGGGVGDYTSLNWPYQVLVTGILIAEFISTEKCRLSVL